MRAHRILALVALCAMCMVQSGVGQRSMGPVGTPAPSTTPPGTMGHGDEPSSMSTGMQSPDQAFMTKAAQGGMAEVQLGKLAKQNGGSEAVKQFGNRMVDDHTQANQELMQIAKQKGITLPSTPTSKDKKFAKTLQAKQGADFDKSYMQNMVKDHQTDIAEFRQEAQNGQDPAVKAWAQKTLPTLESHLAEAKKVAGQVNLTPAMSSPHP